MGVMSETSRWEREVFGYSRHASVVDVGFGEEVPRRIGGVESPERDELVSSLSWIVWLFCYCFGLWLARWEDG